MRFCSALVAVVACGVSDLGLATSLPSHLAIAYGAVQELLHLPQDEVTAFFEAYDQLEKMPVGMPTDADKKAVHDYYRVLHRGLANTCERPRPVFYLALGKAGRLDTSNFPATQLADPPLLMEDTVAGVDQ